MFKVGQKIKVIGTKEQLYKIDVPEGYMGKEGFIDSVNREYFNNDNSYDLYIRFTNEWGTWGIMRDYIKIIGEPE